LYGGQRVPVEISSAGLLARHANFEHFSLQFTRSNGEKGFATEVGHGGDWYASERYTGPRTFEQPKAWSAFVGHYRNDSPWIGSFRVVARKGKLWLDGIMPLEAKDETTFRLADSSHNPEWIQFRSVVNGKARHLKFSGEDFWRVDAK
jgi:hypothetical protein